MKVFVYDKKTNQTIEVFVGVKRVETSGKKIYITTSDSGVHSYDTTIVKTRIYQN